MERERKVITLLQPSLHTVDEFNREAIEEMYAIEPDNKTIAKLYKEYEALPENDDGPESEEPEYALSEALNEICDDMMQALTHDYYFEDDTFIIYE